MELKAKVQEVSQTQQVTDTLKKRELIVEYSENEKYQEYLKFEAVNDKCDLLDNVKPGDDVEVHFNLRGRPYTDKTGKKSYFNSLQLWKITVLGASNSVPSYAPPIGVSANEDLDDLPF